MNMNNPNMADILKEAEKVQAKIENIRLEISNKVYVGRAGGKVQVELRGDFFVVGLKVSDELLSDPESLKHDLGALVAAAINDAKEQLNDDSANSLKPLMKELGLPEDFEFPVQ